MPKRRHEGEVGGGSINPSPDPKLGRPEPRDASKPQSWRALSKGYGDFWDIIPGASLGGGEALMTAMGEALLEREGETVKVVTSLVEKVSRDLGKSTGAEPVVTYDTKKKRTNIDDLDVRSKFKPTAEDIIDEVDRQLRTESESGTGLTKEERAYLEQILAVPTAGGISPLASDDYTTVSRKLALHGKVAAVALEKNAKLVQTPKEREENARLEKREAELGSRAHRLSLTKADAELAQEEARLEFARSKGAVAKGAPDDLAGREDLAQETLREMFDRSPSSGRSSEAGNASSIEALANHELFGSLQRTMGKLRAVFKYDSGPDKGKPLSDSDLYDELQKRALVSGNYWVSDVIILAAIGPDELKRKRGLSQKRLASLIEGTESSTDLEDHLRTILSTANTFADTALRLNSVAGYPPSRSKLEQFCSDPKVQLDDADKLRATILVGLGRDAGLKELLAAKRLLGGIEVKPTNDLKMVEQADKLMRESFGKLAKIDQLSTANTSTSPGKKSSESGLNPSPKKPDNGKVLDWLRRSERFQALEELILSDEWHKRIYDYTGLDIINNPKDLERFCEIFFMQDLTSIEGIIVFIKKGEDEQGRPIVEEHPIEKLREQQLTKASDFPIGKLLEWMIRRRTNKNEPIPREVLDHYAQVEEEIDWTERSPDTLLEWVRVNLEARDMAIQIMEKAGIKFPPSYEEVMRVVEQIERQFPDSRVRAWLPLMVGMTVEDQKKKRPATNEGEPEFSARENIMIPNAFANFPGFIANHKRTLERELDGKVLQPLVAFLNSEPETSTGSRLEAV